MMGLGRLSACRYLSIILLFSFEDQRLVKGNASTESCNIFSVYWEIHSEDPNSYLAIDDLIIRELKNGASGLLQLEGNHTIKLMHNNVYNIWMINTSNPTYAEYAASSRSSSIDMLLNLSSDAQNPNKNYFAIFLNKENFCTRQTVHLLEDSILTLAIVASDWFPVSVNSSFASQIEVSWNPAYLIGDESFVTLVLYDVNGMLLEMVSASGKVHTFPALFPCTEYRICLSTEQTNNQVCVTGLTDPLPPTNFTVLRTNSSSVTVHWDKPALGKYTSLRLEARVIQSIPPIQPTLKTFTLMQYGKEFTILGLPSCQKVNISAWTMCDSNKRKPSRTIFAITVTGPSEITLVSHKRTSDGMLLSWTPPPAYNFIRIAVGGELHGFTRNNSYLVTGLPSCTEHEYKLAALCGKSSSGIVTVRDYTGPGSISEMKIQMDEHGTEPLVTWKTLSGENATFDYRLLDTPNDIIETDNISAHAFQLKKLKNDTEYVLEVFETCKGDLGPSSSLNFVLYNITTLYEDELSFKKMRIIPVLTTWKSNCSVKCHLKANPTPVDNVKTIVQKLASECPVIKAVMSEITSQSNTTKMCLTVSFVNETRMPNIPTPVQLLNVSGNKIPSWSGCFDSTDAKYPTSGIICESFLRPISGYHDQVIKRKDVTTIKTPNYSTTRKAGSQRKLVYSLLDATESSNGNVLSTPEKENYLDSEISVLCDLDFMKINVSKAYLERQIQQPVKLLLNDGSCLTQNTGGDYYEYTVLFEFPFCGGQMLVNETHITFQHKLQNTYDPGTYITRSDFTLIWQCVYLRDKVLSVHDGALSSIRSLFKKMVRSGLKVLRFSKKLLLIYVLTLYMDDSFSPRSAVNSSVTFGLWQNLYLEVKADIIDRNFNKTFLLSVVSCWATMSADPEEGPKYFFLQNSCPADTSFKWHSPKGVGAVSRFSIQMFHFSNMKERPIYIHCSSTICSYENSQDCLKECSASETPHPESLLHRETPLNSMISEGPITIMPDSTVLESDDRLSYLNWSIITTVSGIVGLLIILFFGIKIITAVLNGRQKGKTYPSRTELMVNTK